MQTLLLVIAVLAGLVGGLLLSNATAGVGVICGGCLAAILARIVQAGQEQEELRALRGEMMALRGQLMPRPQQQPPSADGWPPIR